MAQDILLARQQETILNKLASYFSDDLRRLCTQEGLDADITMDDFLPVEWNQISLHSIRHLTMIDLVCHYHSVEHNNISNTEVYFNRTENWLLVVCPSPEIIPDLMLECAGTLKTFHLSGFDIPSLPSLVPLQHLTALSISKCRNLTQLAGLGGLSQLTFLYLSGCEELTELPGLENLTQLTFLNLSECKKLADFSGLENLTQLTYLNLYGCRKLSKLCGLNNLTQLRFLNLSKCPMLSELSGCENLTHVPESIRNMSALRKLYLCRLTLDELPDWLPEITDHFTMDRILSNGEKKPLFLLKIPQLKVWTCPSSNNPMKW